MKSLVRKLSALGLFVLASAVTLGEAKAQYYPPPPFFPFPQPALVASVRVSPPHWPGEDFRASLNFALSPGRYLFRVAEAGPGRVFVFSLAWDNPNGKDRTLVQGLTDGTVLKFPQGGQNYYFGGAYGPFPFWVNIFRLPD